MSDEKNPKPVRLIKGELVRGFRTEPRGDVGAVSGTVRLASAREIRDFFDGEFPDLMEKHKSRTFAESHLYARLIKSWDVPGEGDATEPITPENVAALPDAAWGQLLGIATGQYGEYLRGN